MSTWNSILRKATTLLGVAILAMGLSGSPAYAQMVETESLLAAPQTEPDRVQIKDALNREDIRQKLAELGVDANDIAGRVDSLTDEEARTLAQRIDSLPAGAGTDVVTILLLVIIIILLV